MDVDGLPPDPFKLDEQPMPVEMTNWQWKFGHLTDSEGKVLPKAILTLFTVIGPLTLFLPTEALQVLSDQALTEMAFIRANTLWTPGDPLPGL